jgi:hypothetical protein
MVARNKIPLAPLRYTMAMSMRILALFVFLPWVISGQSLPRLQFTERAPDELLASRAAAFFTTDFSQAELAEIQRGFQQIGIDAVAYFERDKVLAGTDPARVYASYLTSREIKFLVLMEKNAGAYVITITPFNGKPTFCDDGQPAWRVEHARLNELLLSIYRDSWLTQKKQNFLINDVPEMPEGLQVIAGRRSEFYAIDLKVDNLAVPKTGHPEIDQQLEQFFATYYPYKYKFVEPGYDERELRKAGFHYVLSFLRTRGKAARELLGYDMTKAETAYASVTYPNGATQIKTIAATAPVVKFYFKHIESGNVFLGNKWDADDTYLQALKNHLMGFRAELKLN